MNIHKKINLKSHLKYHMYSSFFLMVSHIKFYDSFWKNLKYFKPKKNQHIFINSPKFI
jgi:hypothetical protein